MRTIFPNGKQYEKGVLIDKEMFTKRYESSIERLFRDCARGLLIVAKKELK